jgi:cell wall-associated NlpC family hydrolase
MTDRQRVAAIALEWIKTPYVHEGRIKHLAADCTFFIKVFEEARLVEPIAIPHYSPQAHLNRQAASYLAILTRYTKEIAEAQADVGDVVMYCIARTWSHGGLIVEPGWPHIVHADMRARAVIPAIGNKDYLGRFERRFFSFFGRGA